MPDHELDLAALVDQMPDVDPPPQPKDNGQDDSTPPPDPNRPGKFTGPDPVRARQIYTRLLEGGQEALVALTQMVRAPGDPDFVNYKPRYVLHGLFIHTGRPGHDQDRLLLTQAVASELAGAHHSKAAKALLIEALQAGGDPGAVDALAQHLADPELSEPAARALLAIDANAAAQFHHALPHAQGRVRLNLLQALGETRDAQSLPALEDALHDEEPEVRMVAAKALAKIAHPSSAPVLLEAADQARNSERVRTTHACFLLAKNLRAAGHESAATRIYLHLQGTRTDESENYIRESANRALNPAG